MTQPNHDTAFSFDFEQITHVAKEFRGNLYPPPPPSFLTPECRVCYEIPCMMSVLYTTFRCEKGLCGGAWDVKATAQKEQANTRTISGLFSRSVLSSLFYPYIILNHSGNANTL